MTNCVTASFTFVCCRIEAINKRNDVSSCRRAENWKWKVGNKFPFPRFLPFFLSSLHFSSHFFSSFPHCYTLLLRFYQFPAAPLVALFFCTGHLSSLPQFLFNFVSLIELIRSIFSPPRLWKNLSRSLFTNSSVFFLLDLLGREGKKIIKIKANYLKWSQGIKLSIKIN